ncbi:MAG: glycosyltransferase family 4 protein, partial [Bacteroidota bacterium]
YETKKVSKIDGLISVTPLICERFKPFAKNVEMIANYPIEEEFDKNDFLGIRKKEKQICYIGGLFPIRGIREIILALEYTDAKLVLAGEFLTPEFEVELRQLKNWDRIEYVGIVNRKKIAEILFQSHIGLVTLHPTRSFKESIPIKMFEYMLAGLPVISSNFELWEKYVLEHNCGFMVDPLNPKAIADKINLLLENEDLASEMGENANKMVKKHYTWKSQEEKLIKFYNKIIHA